MRFNAILSLLSIALLAPAAVVSGQEWKEDVRVEKRVIIRSADGQTREITDPDELREVEMRVESGNGQVRMGAMMMTSDGQVFAFGDLDPSALNGAVVRTPNGPTVTFVDPGRSYLLPLVRRQDVQRHLELNMRQLAALKEAEDAAAAKTRAAMADQTRKLQEQIAKSRGADGKVSISFDSDAVSALKNLATNPPVDLESILRPEQMDRLRQIDRQYRGPLSMADAKVSELVPVEPEQRTQVDPLLREYRTKMNEGVRSVLDLQRSQRAAQSGTAGAGRALSTVEMRARLRSIRDAVEGVRKANGTKALGVLSAEQRAAWKRLQGAPFRFVDQA